LVAAGVLLRWRWPRLGTSVLLVGVLFAWVTAMPATAYWSARALERHAVFEPAALAKKPAEAIVALAGGARTGAPEFAGGEDVRGLTLERVRYTAHLHRLTGLPIALSGGVPQGMMSSEAELMRRALDEDFDVAVRYVEQRSRNTAGNAAFCRAVLPFKRIVLVTHALHMPRAEALFSAAGFEVIPAPMGFVSAAPAGGEVHDYLPSLSGLADVHYVMYEFLGTLWYRLRGVW
jgi:uncharacterized SAM-binding protein YcdF (DUF218 family)